MRSRLIFTPDERDGKRSYTFSGEGTITSVLAGVIGACAKGVVSPTGFEAESTSTWTCTRTLALGASRRPSAGTPAGPAEGDFPPLA